MGEGGVACVPSQHVVERFSISGGQSNGNGTNANASNIELSSNMNAQKSSKKKKKIKKVIRKKKGGDLGLKSSGNCKEQDLGSNNHSSSSNINSISRVVVSDLNKDEVEEGELGTLPELIVDDRWRKGEEDVDAASGSWRKDELEKGEFVPDRWRPKDDYSYSRGRRYDSAKEKIWKGERDWTTPPPPPPPSGKYLSEKELCRSANQVNKRGGILGRGPKMSSKFVDEDGYEVNNGKNYAKEYFSGNRLKRPGFDGDNKHEDYTSSKSRKLSANGARSMYSTDQPAQRAAYRNAPASSRQVSSDRYSSRHYDSSRMAHDKYNSSESRARHYDHRERSPGTGHHDRSRSPYDRSRHSPYDRSHQGDRSRSPYDRSRQFKRSPSYSEWSPSDQARYQRGGTPSFTPPDHGRPRELNRKGVAFQKKQSSGGRRGAEEKPKQKDPNGRDLRTAVKDSGDRINLEKSKNVVPDCGPTSQVLVTIAKEMIQENGTAQDLVSMEEDMDICNTPPHEPVVDTAISGKWFYLNQLGDEQGPSRLCDLKKLMEEGFIVSDHLVKHLDSDRWVTVEKAVSPVANANITSVVPDSSSALVSPPEASGNLLVDTDDVVDTSNQVGQGIPYPSSGLSSCLKRCLAAIEPGEDLNIDGRVDAFLDGHTLIPGKELNIVGEMLHMMSGDGEWERWRNIEGFTCPQIYLGENHTQISDEMVVSSESTLKEGLELSASGLTLTDEKGSAFDYEDVVGFSGQWPCKGGDWKRTDETAQDRTSRKKLVLNGSYPLCQMPKSGFEDPRWQCKDKLYYPSQSKKLDLPHWACSLAEDWNDSIVNRMAQSKLSITREMRGIMLPVVRINACVLNDPEPVASDSRMKAKSKGKYSKSSRNYSATGEPRRSSSEGLCRPKSMHDKDSRGFQTSNTSFSVPKDRVCTADELQLGLGEWYYVDGAGHERGPLSFSELQVLVDQGVIQKYSSAFRKVDKVWVPVTSASKTSENTKTSEISGGNSNKNSENFLLKHDDCDGVSSRFHTLHPQFIGYTRGKLHELVMKTYKSREFAAAINEVLDPWLNARQPKKEMEKQIYNSTLLQKSDQCKKLHASGSDNEDEMEHAWTPLKDELPFDAMCGNANFGGEKGVHPELGNGSWVQLDGLILARVFHFLRADVKTLVNVALTCKIWRSVLSCYKKASRQVDLSSIAPTCNDAMLWNIMEGYNKENVCTLVLRGCLNITPHMLEDVLQSFLSMSSVDIRGCGQLEDLASKFTNIYWIKSRTVHSRSMKHVTDKSPLASKLFSSLDAHADDSSGLRHYLESSERRDSANQFRQSLYKRPKLYDTRQSSSILSSRDTHLRRLAMRNSYKRMERLIALKLKDIMKENTFGIFVPKVAEIENRMRTGYYNRRGLSCVKEDIGRMCRDAMKSKKRGGARDMNHIIALFIRLAISLDGSADSSSERGRDGSPPGFSASAKQKKKIMDKRYMNRGNGSAVVNDISECGDYPSDREIKRHLSRLNKKPMDSGSETSDDPDRSSDGSLTDSESTASDTESDLDLKSEIGGGGSRRDQYIPPDDGLDSLADEREWGARMTKSGLVPPVTRKYEVIDEYVIVAEEEEVKRKMRVSFPEDYDEKLNAQLNAQRNGTEESETQIPIQKEYKPRKQLGIEVIEQEVYGIDPYTHNLILDSIQDVSDWTLPDKHIFIENVLLRVLNKQVRRFTGSGTTPMVYQLKPAFEEILDTAEEEHDEKTVRLCENMLKAIDSRPGDNYVAYRKGLGVVCNKEGGFSEDDFVVEFLGEVYPAWKWYEKQDGIRSLQKNSKDPAPEFYNILLDRPKGDADGFDLLVVDAMHKANYASRICHSCKPNCEAKVTAVNGQYLIGIYSVRPIQYGEEVTFDYNSVTESKQEAEASVCLCGSEVCRGSYLNLLGEGAFEKVRIEFHGVLDRHQLLLEACELNSVSEEDHIDLLKAGLGRCLLDGLPDWLIAYSARLVRFINFERVELSKELLRHNLDEKKKYHSSEISIDHEKREAEIQANGVFDRRLQDLAITLNKVRYVMRCVFGNPKTAPPPLQRLSARERVSYLWTGEESLVKELLECIAPHVDDITLKELKAKIHAHDPSNSEDIELGLKKSLIWLRDEVRDLSCSSKCRHDAAADLIHIYAHTKCFIKMREYKTVTSPPVYISPLDLCQKSGDSLGTQGHEYFKTYGENYCLGQLIYWYNHDKANPDCSLARGSRGCLSLPEMGSFYAKVQKPSRQRVYGTKTVKFMLSRMKKQPQKPWPKDWIWSFTDTPKVFGSPMLDAVINKASLDKEMVHWLKNRVSIFQAMGDR